MESLKEKKFEAIKRLNLKLKRSEKALLNLSRTLKVTIEYAGVRIDLSKGHPAYISAYALVEQDLKKDISDCEQQLNEMIK